MLACSLAFLSSSFCFFCLRASDRASKQLVAMAPLKAVAVLVGTAGVSGVVHFQQEGDSLGYGFSLLALVFFSFLSFLPCRD